MRPKLAREKREKLREAIESTDILVMPGVGDPFTALIAEQVGFKAIFSSGAVIANVGFGKPDIGLITMSEVLERTENICGAVQLPVFADADTGYGNAINVIRTVQEFERIGVAGLMLEDQLMPKRCGHFEGKKLVPLEEMIEKILAFKRARTDSALVLIARTDANAVEGFDEAIRRGKAFAAAGADMVFVEAPTTRAEQEAIPAAIDAPTLANMVEGGKTPLKTARELEELGYSGVVFPSTAMRVAGHAMKNALESLLQEGSSQEISPVMFTWEQRQSLVNLPKYQALEQDLQAEAKALLETFSPVGVSD